MTSRLAPLLRRFSPRLVRLDADGAHPVRAGSGSVQVLVARGLCLFIGVDASSVPLKQRTGFVALQVRRAAPFSDPQFDIAWFGDHAAVWYWSRSRVAALFGTLPSRIKFRADACYRGNRPDGGDAVELLDLRLGPAGDGPASGFEARRWKRGQLVGSRWWPALPTATQWQTFLRGSGLDPTLPLPEPANPPLNAQPLGGLHAHAWTGQVQTHWPLLAAGTACVVTALFAYQLAAVARAQRGISQTQQRVVALERRLETVITARTRADDAMREMETLLALRPTASQTRLMAEIAQVTPGTGWRVLMWQQATPEILEVTLQGSVPDATELVGAWEQSPLLSDVTPATGSRADELTIRARLAPASAMPVATQ